MRFIQVAVPSRQNVDAYQEYRSQVDAHHRPDPRRVRDAAAGFPSTTSSAALPAREVATLYRAADVMLVTPIRDGMNLVAKEFVACRSDEDGVLVLSEFAGADRELAESLHVNPFDTAGMAEAFYRALVMPREERRDAHARAPPTRACGSTSSAGRGLFLDALAQCERERPERSVLSSRAALAALAARIAAGHRRRSAARLRRDAGAVRAHSRAGHARSGPARALARARPRPGYRGPHRQRPKARRRSSAGSAICRSTSTPSTGSGAVRRGSRDARSSIDASWKDRVLPILFEYADRTPGTLVEEKPAGLAWHYRMADPQYGRSQANELRKHLTELLSNTPVEILAGHEVIELRPHGVNKGRVVGPIVERARNALIVAIGDDATDEDMFAALPPAALSIRVGAGDSRAEFRVGGVVDVRALLKAVIDPGID